MQKCCSFEKEQQKYESVKEQQKCRSAIPLKENNREKSLYKKSFIQVGNKNLYTKFESKRVIQ